MKAFFRKVIAWARQTWVWTLLGVLVAVLAVWFVGPMLAINDHKFWSGPTARLLTISALLLGWGLGMVFINGRDRATPRATKGPSGFFNQRDIDNEQQQLRSRFKAALRTLKTTRLYSDRSARGRNELPWYLLMGSPASGKTSLLDSSGLEFPINTLERRPMGDASGTRYCDWYFAKHGVLLDTAGRYLSQMNEEVDARGWVALLELLRKRRRNRPLSGVLLTVPVEVLLQGSDGQIAELGDRIRGRLQELEWRLGVNVPVYLVLSKADVLPGFTEFFDSLTREESDQVLGASFNLDQRSSHVAVVRAEFEALLHRLGSQVIRRMHPERDTSRLGRILDFPQQLGRVGANLCLLVEHSFAGNICPMRGFYLTCASQPIRHIDPADAQGDAGRHPGDGSSGSQGGGKGGARFIQHLFSRVIFPQADLAGTSQRERRRAHWRQRALYGGALSAVGLCGLLWANGFSTNHERLEQLRTLAQRWDQQRSVPMAGDDPVEVLRALDIRLEATQVFAPEVTRSSHERVGLYQGDASNPVVTKAYERELEVHLLPSVAQMLEDHIRSNLNNREQLINSLRAYLMLNLPERRDAGWLKARVASAWALRYPTNMPVQDGLNGHFQRLLELPFVHSLDDSLVTQAREALRSESLASVVYRMLRDQASHLGQYRLSQHLGAQGALLVGTDHVIPGFYTRQGYEQYFSIQGKALVTGLLRENWVMGEGAGLSATALRRLMMELEQVYFRDYADYWSEAVGSVALRPVEGAHEGAEQLAGLTSAHSPILQMLVQVRENTRIQTVAERIDEAAQTVGSQAVAATPLAAVTAKASDALVDKLPAAAQKAMQRRFEPLHRLLDADNAPAPDLTLALRALDDLHLQLAGLARASAPEQAAFEMAKNRMAGQRDAISNLRSAAARLPRPMSAWFGAVAEDSWRLVLSDSYRYLNQRYQTELYSFYGKAIHKRYPFNAHSVSDVALNDFQDFFKDDGIVDRFFENYMRPFVSGDPGHYRLRKVDGQSLPVSRVYLNQLAAAHTIRRSFFVENQAQAQAQFKLEPYTLDPAVSRAEFRMGDKTLEYRHGPILPMAFTWPDDAHNGRTALVLDKLTGQAVGIEKNTGPWSLFRLLDLMQTEYLTGRDVRVLKADLGGLRANYLLVSQRAPNPFDMGVLRTFRLPVQL